jgi:DNA-binding PadR family transcriptional regulator
MYRRPVHQTGQGGAGAGAGRRIFLDNYSEQSTLTTMPARSRSNPLALAVLSCLYERPMHPYEVAQTLRSRAKHESIRLNYGSLYSVVDALEGKGLIRARETVREGRRPERTVYEITDAGEIELVDWLSELVSSPTKEYLNFEAALSFIGVLPPDDAVILLNQRALTLEVLLAQRRGVRRAAEDMGLPRLFLLEDEYMTHLLEAELDWVRKLVKDIDTGALDGLDGWRAWAEGDRSAFGDWDADLS